MGSSVGPRHVLLKENALDCIGKRRWEQAKLGWQVWQWRVRGVSLLASVFSVKPETRSSADGDYGGGLWEGWRRNELDV